MDRFIKIGRRKIKTSKTSILGLDCSSATVGWGLVVLNKNPTLVAHGHIKPLDSKHGDIERLDDIYHRIGKLCDVTRPSCVAVEDVFLFMKGKSTARTITLLAAFNRVISLAAYQKVGDVRLYSVHDIRNLISKQHDLKIDKESMPEAIKACLESDFEPIINKRGNIAKETYDEADGIAAAWAHTVCVRNPDLWTQIQEARQKSKKKGKK
jgi:Holliday junction resolvasome RuvABC endonuclease subunit